MRKWHTIFLFFSSLKKGTWILKFFGTSRENDENILVKICKGIVSWKKSARVYFSCYLKGPFSRFGIWAAHPVNIKSSDSPGFVHYRYLEKLISLTSLSTQIANEQFTWSEYPKTYPTWDLNGCRNFFNVLSTKKEWSKKMIYDQKKTFV